MIKCVVVLIPSLVCTTAAVGYACTFSWDVAGMFLLCLFVFLSLREQMSHILAV